MTQKKYGRREDARIMERKEYSCGSSTLILIV
jgi:predicted double-glycine peptidase